MTDEIRGIIFNAIGIGVGLLFGTWLINLAFGVWL